MRILNGIEKGLYGIIALMGVFIILSFKQPAASEPLPAGGGGVDAGPYSDTAGLRPFEDYQRALKKRDLFDGSFVPQDLNALAPGGGAAAASFPLSLPANLKIVGILIGSPSEAVFEDTASRQTYIIAEGKSEAGIGVQSVRDNQVVLTYQGQPITMSLKGN